MKILTVIPIAKGIPRDELSYFSAKPISLGTIVTVPFGKRSIKGVVVDQNEVRDLKSSIKSSDFALRNITTIHPETLPTSVFTATQNTARFYAQSVGPLLETILPHQVFDYYITHPIIEKKPTHLRPDIQAIQIPYTERLSYYRTLIRENLGKQVSTLIITPTVIQAEKIFSEMKTGIEEKIALAHSKRTKKQLDGVLRLVLEKKNPVVLIATAPFATLVRNDWDTFIIESSSSPHYRYSFSSVFDLRFFVEEMARSCQARLIYADTFLGTSVRSRITKREIIDVRSTWHISKPEQFELPDMKVKPFTLLHETTKKLIEKAIQEKSSSILLTTRKGLAPLTSCSDCGAIVNCPICGTPLVLHRKKGSSTERIYMCHHCLHTTAPQDTCASCGSWKLATLGISTDSIAEETEKLFPKTKTFICDGDSATTPLQTQKIIASWQKQEGSILIATPMIIPYIDKASFGSIVSMDSLLSIPAYTSSETSLATVLSFLERIAVAATLQTRNPKHDALQAISSENLFDFSKQELASRTEFGYPPAKILLKISLETKAGDAKDAVTYFEKIFSAYDPDLLMKKSKLAGKIIVQGIMKLEISVWNNFDHEIHQLIQGLGREWKKEVNPDTVL